MGAVTDLQVGSRTSNTQHFTHLVLDSDPGVNLDTVPTLQNSLTAMDEMSVISEGQENCTAGTQTPLYDLTCLLPELISEICLDCPPMMPFILCQVCTTWRQIVMQTPLLWTDISLTVLDAQFDKQMRMLRTWCDRAGTLPLSITLKGHDCFSADHDPIQRIIPYISHIRVLDLELPRSCFQTICGLPDGSLQSLERCKLIFRYPTVVSEFKDAGTITLFESAPCLRHLSIIRAPFYLSIRVPPQLTSLHLRLDFEFQPRRLIGIFRACPNLKSASATIGGRLTYPMDTALMPRMRKLGLTIENSYLGFGLFLDHVALPMLDHFEVWSNSYMIEDWPQAPFLSLLSRSSYGLKTLVLERTTMSTIQLLECLRTLPLLVKLRIKSERLQCTILCDALGDRALDFVPMLEELELRVNNGLREFEDPFVRMLESRRSSPSCTLRKAYVAVASCTTVSDVLVTQRISRLQQGGLVVVVDERVGLPQVWKCGSMILATHSKSDLLRMDSRPSLFSVSLSHPDFTNLSKWLTAR